MLVAFATVWLVSSTEWANEELRRHNFSAEPARVHISSDTSHFHIHTSSKLFMVKG
jgi:hypothetical protein